jgi:hypothetical protein
LVKAGCAHAAIRAARPAFGARGARIKQKLLSTIEENPKNRSHKKLREKKASPKLGRSLGKAWPETIIGP